MNAGRADFMVQHTRHTCVPSHKHTSFFISCAIVLPEAINGVSTAVKIYVDMTLINDPKQYKDLLPWSRKLELITALNCTTSLHKYTYYTLPV